MFYLKRWMCECGQTGGHVRGLEEYLESWWRKCLAGRKKEFKGPDMLSCILDNLRLLKEKGAEVKQSLTKIRYCGPRFGCFMLWVILPRPE